MSAVETGPAQEPSIIAVALAGDASVDVYRRSGETVSVTRNDFAPWLIVNDSVIRAVRRVAFVEPLHGEGHFNSLLRFASWSHWRDAFRSLREANPGQVLAFPNPADQYIIMSGHTQMEHLEFDEIRRAQLDIETTGLDPFAPDARILMIAISLNGEDPRVLRADGMSESEMIGELDAWIQEQDPDVIEGHNLYNFDIPYLLARSQSVNRNLLWGRDGSPLRQGGTRRFKAGARTIPFDAAYVRGRHLIDTYQQIQRYDYAGMLRSYGLKESIGALGLERPDREHVAGEHIQQVWKEDPDRLEYYAIDDLRDTDMLSRLTLPTEFYQTRLLPSPLQDVATGGPGEKVNDLLVREYVSRRESIPVPDPPRGYPGGYTEIRRVGIFSPVVKCDVESLYPAIMLTDRIAPASDRLDVFLPLLSQLTHDRLEAKRNAAREAGYARARWDGIQSSLKVLINSFYGYLGYSRGYFNDFNAAEQVTVRGHQIISSVTDSLERLGARTIEIDTDGVYFEPPDSVRILEDEIELIENVSSELPDGINLAHDGQWRSMLSLRLKNYALLGYDDRLYLKGSGLRNRRDEPYLRRFIEEAARIYLRDEPTEQVRTLYLDLSMRLQNGDLEPGDIARTETITEQTFRSASTRKLAEALGSERVGERVSVYQRSNGEIARLESYDGDEDRQYLLRRLRAAAERFRPLYDSQESFDYDFPTVTLRTDINALRTTARADQMRLF